MARARNMVGSHPDLPRVLPVLSPRDVLTTHWAERPRSELWRELDGTMTLIADPELGERSLRFTFTTGVASRAQPKPPREYSPTEEGLTDVNRDSRNRSRRRNRPR